MNPKFIKKLQKNNKIRIIHNKKLLKQCRVKTRIIRTQSDFYDNILSRVYLPKYKRRGNRVFFRTDSELVKLHNYKPNKKEVKHIKKIIKRNKKTPVITIAYHKRLQETLVVDGVHRSIGVKSGLISYPITILEYYGDIVPYVFNVEFMNILFMRLNINK